jgi:cell division protein FtsN
MGSEILIILVIWLTIGVVIGGWISVDTFGRKVKGAKWVAVGVLLSVIGLMIYLWMRDKKKSPNRSGHDTAPEYRYQEPSPLEVRPIPVAETIAKPVPVEQRTTSVKEPLPPVPEPEAPQEAAPLTMPEESRPEYRNEQPLRQKIEGIPRCPKCGVAVSGFDEFCSECGTKLK